MDLPCQQDKKKIRRIMKDCSWVLLKPGAGAGDIAENRSSGAGEDPEMIAENRSRRLRSPDQEMSAEKRRWSSDEFSGDMLHLKS